MDWSQLFEASTWSGFTQNIFSTPSNFIALAALLVSLSSAWSSRHHSRLSVLPAFATWADYPTAENPTCTIMLSNKGFGPGIIQSFEAWHGHYRMPGRAHKPIRCLIERVFKGYQLHVEKVAGPEKGHTFGAGEDLVLARFDVDRAIVDGGDDYFEVFFEPVSLLIFYRDIYGREWVYLVEEFEGHTHLLRWWKRPYLWIRYKGKV